MFDPMYSPTEEEIADAMRRARRKFSNRFVPMNTYHDAMMRVDALEKQVEALEREKAAVEKALTISIHHRLAQGAGEGGK